MKGILKFITAMAVINMAGRAFSGAGFQIPQISDTVECVKNIASDFADLAEKLGFTFTVNREYVVADVWQDKFVGQAEASEIKQP